MRADGTPFRGLPAAIAAVRDAHPNRPDLQALAWALLPRLPGRPRTSDSLKTEEARSSLKPLEDVVLTDPWLGMNTEAAVNVLWAESDRPGLRERLRALAEAGVRIAWAAYGSNGGGHAAIILEVPVVTGLPGHAEADRMRLRKLSLTRSLLTTAIDGDHHAGLRGMTKNPFSTRWDVEVGDLAPQTLDEVLRPLQALAEAEEWQPPRRRYRGDKKREPSPEGRNCALFDLVRWWAGDGAVKDDMAIMATAVEVNAGFALPLGHGEVACVARSITRFMVNRWDGRSRHVPLAAEVAKVRQAAAGRATAKARAASRDERLLAALGRLQAQGIVPGQREVAAEADVSVSTVKAAWGMLWSRIVNNSQDAPLVSGSSAATAPEAGHACPPEPPCPAAEATPCPPDDGLAPLPLPSPPRAAPPGDGDGLAEGPRIVRLADPARSHAQFTAVEWLPEAVARRRRQASRRRCAEREAWHDLASRRGLRAYRDAVASRFAALFRERNQALAGVQDWTDPDGDVDLVMVAAAREQVAERLTVIRMAYAAKVKAEMRVGRRVDDALQVQERGGLHRFRTAPDAIDRLAMMTARELDRHRGGVPSPT